MPVYPGAFGRPPSLTITDKLWEGLGVVIIFGIAFATILTLIVVPVMYSLFEEFGYHIISALQGPRWKEPPVGQSFFFTRRMYARIWLFLIFIIQIAALGAGAYYLAPKFISIIESTVFQAPTTLKLVIEIMVFVLSIFVQGIGALFVLFLPSWVGLVYLMGRRTADEQYVDVTQEGVIVTSPVERVFVPGSEIKKVRYSRLRNRLIIQAGRRRIKIRNVVEVRKTPAKVPLLRWLATPAPRRSDKRKAVEALKNAIEGIAAKEL